MADLFIIGQFEDISSITAVSIGSQVMHMITVMIVGLAMGATVNIGQAIGAGNKKKAAKDIGNTVTLIAHDAGNCRKRSFIFYQTHCRHDVNTAGSSS